MWLFVLQRLSVELFLDFFYWPLWWYTNGAKRVAQFSWHVFQNGNVTLAPGLWLRNIFVPMFGQTDWQGRIMSFFMRFVNIMVRGAALLVWLMVCAAVFFAWLAWPIFLGYMLIRR